MNACDIFLMLGVLYTGIGSDLGLNWGAGLITGKRLRPDSSNFLERQYYLVHAKGDPNMRAVPPIAGPPDRIPAWNHALAVANGTIVLALEVVLVVGFLTMAPDRRRPRLCVACRLCVADAGNVGRDFLLARADPERGGTAARRQTGLVLGDWDAAGVLSVLGGRTLLRRHRSIQL